MPATAEIKLFPLAEAAGTLRISPQTLRGWCLSGRIPFHRIGRQIMLSAVDLENLVRSARVAQ